jgi:hypothetical protein
MKQVFLIAALIMSCSIKAQDFSVKPIMIQAALPMVGELKSIDTMEYRPGFKIFLMVDGKDIRAFETYRLAIEYVKTNDGQDIYKLVNGRSNFIHGHGRSTADGEKAFFSIESTENIFGKVETLQIKGEITFSTSSKSESVVTNELDYEKSESQKIGTFTVTANSKEEPPGRFPGRDDKGLKVKIHGPHEAISTISFIVDGKDSKSNRRFRDFKDNSWIYSLESTKGSKVAVKINYWVGLKEKTVPFEINLGEQ